MNKDDYVEKLKSQLDQWNAETTKWEEKARTARAEMKTEYQKQLATLSVQREAALTQLRLLQGASTEAWKDMVSGADDAWKHMRDAFAKAREHFDRK